MRLRSIVFGLVAVLMLTALLFPPPNKSSPVLEAVPVVEAAPIDYEFCNALQPVCVSIGEIDRSACQAEGEWWWTCDNRASRTTRICMTSAGCRL